MRSTVLVATDGAPDPWLRAIGRKYANARDLALESGAEPHDESTIEIGVRFPQEVREELARRRSS